MNAIGDEHDRVDPGEWERPEMRAVLAVRDMTGVYRSLQKLGFSQQRIGAMTGQSQPEVSAIIHGRKVMAYDVLERSAEGLGIPRGYLGLSYAEEPGQGGVGCAGGGACARVAGAGGGAGDEALGAGAAPNGSEVDDPVQRREFLGVAAAVALGGHAPTLERWLPQPVGPVPPVPANVGVADVEQIRAMTRHLFELGEQLGGNSALDAITGYLRWASGLLRASCSADTGRQLRVALADLYGVAGHHLQDSGRPGEANRHLMQGLVLARDTEAHELAANLLWRMGRVHLEREQVTDALRFFQLAQIAALDCGSHAELGRLYANEAWAYALTGQPTLVADALARAEHENSLALAEPGPSAFHGAARYLASSHGYDPLFYVARTHGLLARGTGRSATRSAELAMDAAARLLAAENLPGLSLAMRQTTRAGAMLHARERDAGLTAAHDAVDRVAAIRSARAIDRLRHVAEAAKAWPRHRPAVDLRRRIANLRAV
jgi:hypothetical protein